MRTELIHAVIIKNTNGTLITLRKRENMFLVQINDVKTKLELDTRSDITFINEKTWR